MICKLLITNYPFPQILVLDEATASMDPEMDALVQGALKEVFEGCTLLIIAHRLTTVSQVDRVLVMEKGEVIIFTVSLSKILTKGVFASY